MDLSLTSKRALVTGSSRGIGRAIAIQLAQEGCQVVLVARGQSDLAEAVSACETAAGRSGCAIGLCGDLTQASEVDAVCQRAVGLLGGIDILINNLGGSGGRNLAGFDAADLQRILDLNLWPAFRVTQALLPQMQARQDGVIVMIASIWGREAGGGPSYNVAKAAEISYAKALAPELAKQGIRVNSVAPGSVWFPGGGWDRRQKQDPQLIADFVARELPFGRFGSPQEIADVVTFLVSPRAAWIHGACISVDGGQSRSF